MTDIEAKCRYLLFVRMQRMFQEEYAVTSVLLRGWGIQDTQQNPPNLRGLPHSLQHVTQYAMEEAYITPRDDKETT
jgi:hypothetical protein